MNKLLLTLLTTAAMVTASAADYQYLTFEMTDGTKASVEAANLSLIFDGTTLKVGKESFTLTNLTKMYFSTGDETTGILQLYTDCIIGKRSVLDVNLDEADVNGDGKVDIVDVTLFIGKTLKQIENGEWGNDNSAEFFDLNGKKVSKDQMRRLAEGKKGIYIVKTKNGTSKLTVR